MFLIAEDVSEGKGCDNRIDSIFGLLFGDVF